MITEWSHFHPDPSRSQWPFLIQCPMRNCLYSTEAYQGLLVVPIQLLVVKHHFALFQLYILLCAFTIFLPYIYLFNIIFKWISRLKETLKVSEFSNCRNPHHVLPLLHQRSFWVFFLISPLQVQHLLDYLQFHHCTHLSGSSCHSQVALNIFAQTTKGTMHLVIIF